MLEVEPFELLQIQVKLPAVKEQRQTFLSSTIFNVEQEISSADLCGQIIYVGTTMGMICSFQLSTVINLHSNIIQSKAISLKATGLKKPITRLLSLPSESKVGVLVDQTLFFYHINLDPIPITSVQPVRGCLDVVVDSDISSPIRILLSKRKSIALYELNERLRLKHDFALSETPSTINLFKRTVFYADSSNYKMFNLKTTEENILFPFDEETMQPVICNISENEFLLATCSAQGIGIGVFISSKGDPVRGTLQWPAIPLFLCFQFPYVIALLKNRSIQIHNIETQMLVQTIPLLFDATFMKISTFPLELKTEAALSDKLQEADTQNENTQVDPASTEQEDDLNVESATVQESKLEIPPTRESKNSKTGLDFEALARNSTVDLVPGGIIQVLVGTSDSLYSLRMKPWELQVEQLFNAAKYDEAIVLAEQMVVSKPNRKYLLKSYYLKCAFFSLRDTNFQQALKFFKNSDIDPKALIILFPDLSFEFELDMENDAMLFAKSLVSIDCIIDSHILKNKLKDDVKNEIRNNLKMQSKSFLKAYLLSRESTVEVDTCLVKLLAEKQPIECLEICKKSHSIILDQVENILLQNQRYHCLCLLYQQNNKPAECLDLCKKIVTGDLIDASFPGISFAVEYLKIVDDEQIVKKHADWVLRRKPVLGVTIFTMRKTRIFTIDFLMDYIQGFGKKAQIALLEHFIKQPIELEKLKAMHMELAKMYLELVSELCKDFEINIENESFYSYLNREKNPLSKRRLLFYEFVRTSEHIECEELLEMMNSLPNRESLNFEAMALHEKIGDDQKALECLVLLPDHVGAELYCLKKDEKKCFKLLLDIYLQDRFKIDHADIAVQLMLKYKQIFDMSEILYKLPKEWSIGLVSPLLIEYFRRKQHEYFSQSILKSLHQAQQLKHQADYINTIKDHDPIYIPRNPELPCPVCRKTIKDPTLFVLVKDQVIHLHCQART